MPRRLAPLALTVLGIAACAVLFAANVERYRFLTDDAYISFRYAENLVEGHGLVWNPGERVEGYTNFLWTLLLAGALAAGLEPGATANALGIASGAALLVALVVFSARRTGWRSPWIWLAPLGLCTSRSFTAWCTGGLETMFFTLLAFLGCWAFLAERTRGARRPLGSSFLFAAATLTRPEGAIFAAAAGVVLAADLLRRRRTPAAAVAWALPLVALVGGHALWRLAYYGAWLPNTFHAKVPGLWWEQGGRYLALFHADYRIAWFLPLAAFALWRRRDAVAALFGAVLGLYLLYVAAVGGDRFEFRFLVVVLPYLYWLLGDGLRQLAELRRGRGMRLAAAAVTLAVAAALLGTTHRGSRRREAWNLRHGVNSIQAVRQYAAWRAQEGRFLRELVDEGLLPRDLVLAVTGAGALPYYTGWETVDVHGLTDATVARMPVAERGLIAHEHRASYAYLERRGVVILDVLNGIVHPTLHAFRRGPTRRFGDRDLPLYVVPVRGQYLIFASTLPRDELARILAPLELAD